MLQSYKMLCAHVPYTTFDGLQATQNFNSIKYDMIFDFTAIKLKYLLED